MSLVEQCQTPPEITSTATTEKLDVIPLYQKLNCKDLTPEMILTTLESYALGAESFAEEEWKPESIKAFVEGAFMPLRKTINRMIRERRINENKQHLVTSLGSGNAAELAILALLTKSAYIKAVDITPEMLHEGLKRLKYDYILGLAKVISELNFVNKAWVDGVVKFINRADKYFDEDGKQLIKNLVSNNPVKRVDFIQGDMTDLSNGFDIRKKKEVDLSDRENDLVISLAAAQHLPKEKVIPFVQDVTHTLVPKGVFFFNVRLDEQGRVFSDRTIKDKDGNRLTRYYNTFSLSEINDLIYQLSGKTTEELGPNLVEPQADGHWIIPRLTVVKPGTTEEVKVKVEFTGITGHSDPNKPKFLGILITRLKPKAKPIKKAA